MPIRRQPITMDTHKPGDTWAGTWTAMEDPVGIMIEAAAAVVGVETKAMLEITIANVT